MPTADRQEQIVDVAVDLFRRRGYEATSMRQVAEAVGVSKGALYHHFPSKQELLVRIHERFMDELFDKLATRGQRRDPVAELEAFILDLLEMIRDFRGYVEVFFRERHALAGREWESVRERRDAYEGRMRDTVETGMAGGWLRADLDPTVVSFGILGLCNWAYHWFDPDGRLPAEEIARQFSAMVIGGLAQDDRAESRR